MEIIVPAAGLSTRFPNMPPKFLLKDENGDMMIKKALQPLINHTITIGVLQKHCEEHNALYQLVNELVDFDVSFVTIPEVTKGPADTVYQILKAIDISDTDFLIKDCDSYFNHEIKSGNYVCVTKVQQHDVLISLGAKSFVVTNEQGIITDIVEKNVVSDTFCVGGYKFSSTAKYIDTFERIERGVNEIFVSHIIQDYLMSGELFFENVVTDYYDVGTLNDWKKYNESISR